MRAIIWAAVSTKSQVAEGKESIQTQIEEAETVCQKFNWKVADVLQVPGHSRRYKDIHKLAEDASKEGITAFNKMLAHWASQDFDVLIVRDGDRFGRTQTLHSRFAEETIDSGAFIYSLTDGRIDRDNYRMWIAMGGYRAAGEVDSLMKKIKIGHDARFKRGLPVNANVCSSHKIVRNPDNGKAIGIEVDESRRQEFLHLADLILEGVSFKELEIEMYNRYGYARDKGGPHQPQRYYRMLRTPSFWGHHSRGHKAKSKGRWVYEAGHEHDIPDGVEIIYNAFEPMYTGELAEKIKAEIDRRATIMGRRRPNQSYKFSGLMICGACKSSYVYSGVKPNSGYIAMRCSSVYEKNPSTPQCTHNYHLNEKQAIASIRDMLDQVIREGDIRVLTHEDEPVDYTDDLNSVNQRIKALQNEILAMIGQQSKAPKNLQDAYNTKLQEAGDRLETLKQRQSALQTQIATTFTSTKREKDAILELQHLGDDFWLLPNNEINQLLGRLIGDYRFVSFHGDVIGLAKIP